MPEKVDFNRDVRPILSDLCYKCHGFDDKAREAGRRLDTAAGALAEKDGVRAIVPGKLAESDVHVRIHSTDRDEAMPPLKSGKKLSDRQKAVLDRWIEQGAAYAQHWAFQPIQRAPLPDAKAHPANPIDAFIQARLEKEGLTPSPEADSYTLSRRLYLDLIGLPPTPEEADRFVAASRVDRNQAVEKLVDRSARFAAIRRTLGAPLARPRALCRHEWLRERSSAQHLAVSGLGDQALNADMPFDQFTIEQLAGDMLPQPTSEQVIATGFHRNTMLNEEGGIDPLEFRFLAMTDRVATTGTTWLGLTVGCAQCHTHKYDPILHREYYQTHGVSR